VNKALTIWAKITEWSTCSSALPIWLKQPSFQLFAHRPHVNRDRLCGVQGIWCHHIWQDNFRPVSVSTIYHCEQPILHRYYLRELQDSDDPIIQGSKPHTLILFYLLFFLYMLTPEIHRSHAQPCRPKALSRYLFLSTRLNNLSTNPSAAAPESVRRLYIVHKRRQ